MARSSLTILYAAFAEGGRVDMNHITTEEQSVHAYNYTIPY
jgi:hypothetical protein